jgi:hypothetical protein
MRDPKLGRTKAMIAFSSFGSTQSSLLLFSMDFKQQPGESDIAFIKRITTSSSNDIPQKQNNQPFPIYHSTASNVTHKDKTDGVRGVYQRIEEWDEERTADGKLTWEEKVQFDGQRFGNQVQQDNILRKHIGTFF